MQIKNHRIPTFQGLKISPDIEKIENKGLADMLFPVHRRSDITGVNLFLRNANAADPWVSNETACLSYALESVKDGKRKHPENTVTFRQDAHPLIFLQSVESAIKMAKTTAGDIKRMYKRIFKPNKFLTISPDFFPVVKNDKRKAIELADVFNDSASKIKAIAEEKDIKIKIRPPVLTDPGISEETIGNKYAIEVLEMPLDKSKKPELIAIKTDKLPRKAQTLYESVKTAIDKATAQ